MVLSIRGLWAFKFDMMVAQHCTTLCWICCAADEWRMRQKLFELAPSCVSGLMTMGYKTMFQLILPFTSSQEKLVSPFRCLCITSMIYDQKLMLVCAVAVCVVENTSFLICNLFCAHTSGLLKLKMIRLRTMAKKGKQMPSPKRKNRSGRGCSLETQVACCVHWELVN